jgi:phosphotransferase system  glucose/maltose/N-acetylglucosamine-specific IIC component
MQLKHTVVPGAVVQRALHVRFAFWRVAVAHVLFGSTVVRTRALVRCKSHIPFFFFFLFFFFLFFFFSFFFFFFFFFGFVDCIPKEKKEKKEKKKRKKRKKKKKE